MKKVDVIAVVIEALVTVRNRFEKWIKKVDDAEKMMQKPL